MMMGPPREESAQKLALATEHWKVPLGSWVTWAEAAAAEATMVKRAAVFIFVCVLCV
jgi:hypothetical protein